MAQDRVFQSRGLKCLFCEYIAFGNSDLVDAQVVVALDSCVYGVLDAGLFGGGDSVEVLGVSVGEGVRGDEEQLFHAVEGPQERFVVEVVALTDLHALLG